MSVVVPVPFDLLTSPFRRLDPLSFFSRRRRRRRLLLLSLLLLLFLVALSWQAGWSGDNVMMSSLALEVRLELLLVAWITDPQ